MKFKFENTKLSGKGFYAEENTEWLNDNFKFISLGVEFHEVLHSDSENNIRLGWLIMGKITIIADFTTHTKKGMVGSSIEDSPDYCFVYDPGNLLHEFLPEELNDVNTKKSEQLLKKFDWNKLDGDISFEKDVVVFLSLKSEFLFIQSQKLSIRINSSEIMVLNKEKDKEKLTTITKDKGIIHIGEGRSISLGDGKIIINGEDYSPEKIVRKVTNAINKAFLDLKFDF